jgi:hypothetical protein
MATTKTCMRCGRSGQQLRSVAANQPDICADETGCRAAVQAVHDDQRGAADAARLVADARQAADVAGARAALVARHQYRYDRLNAGRAKAGLPPIAPNPPATS